MYDFARKDTIKWAKYQIYLNISECEYLRPQVRDNKRLGILKTHYVRARLCRFYERRLDVSLKNERPKVERENRD